jgi:hypothetical protein
MRWHCGDPITIELLPIQQELSSAHPREEVAAPVSHSSCAAKEYEHRTCVALGWARREFWADRHGDADALGNAD